MDFLPRNVIVVSVSVLARGLLVQMRRDLVQSGPALRFFGRFFLSIIGMDHDYGTVIG